MLSKNWRHIDDKLRERIYKYYWGYLMGVALRYVSDRDMACMVVNDSFVKIFINLNAFECNDRANFNKMLKGWMAKITARTALNELRKHKTSRLQEPLTVENDWRFPVMLQDNLHVQNMWDLINNLAPNYRKVFTLYEIEGFNHDEIAELMGISASSSRVYLTRAKEKLKMLYRTFMA
ncbi:RNA polymerase sigma factor [Parapedobacter sp. GCM10030251]|uniref:RNA polymerase sigma factor n=1 Tax=Parapedobacter sp. GCM10030251 TaxID=3273419 RepID=UPI003622A104